MVFFHIVEVLGASFMNHWLSFEGMNINKHFRHGLASVDDSLF